MVRALPALALGLALALGGTARAQYAQEEFGRVGNATILKIREGGRFNRCAAEIFAGRSNARLAQGLDGKWSLSVPAATTPIRGLLTITVDVGNRSYGHDAVTNGDRAWATLNNDAVKALAGMDGPLSLYLGPNRLVYPMNLPMRQVMSGVEDCVRRSR
jgi:hypothetical protein